MRLCTLEANPREIAISRATWFHLQFSSDLANAFFPSFVGYTAVARDEKLKNIWKSSKAEEIFRS